MRRIDLKDICLKTDVEEGMCGFMISKINFEVVRKIIKTLYGI